LASEGSSWPPRQLGVGLIYWQGLASLFDERTVDVLELEPQTLWEKVFTAGEWRYRVNEALFERVADHPQPKLLHGVGQPLGGLTGDPVAHLPLLREAVRQLQPVWVSEHLSFNRVGGSHGPVETGFLLPPMQSAAGVRVAAENIAAYRRALGRPVAFETGVNYLQPAADQLDDGRFFGEVAEAADCGVLLDLHNLWCNEVNGRARVLDVVEQLPLHRVWEVHLAGGMPLGAYWLDSHSGLVPEPLLDIAAEIVSRLPCLGAINFEVLPEHVDALGLDAVRQQIEQLQDLWRLRPRQVGIAPSLRRGSGQRSYTGDVAEVAEVRAWEELLADRLAARSENAASELDAGGEDPGLGIYRQLIGDARRGNLARALRFTTTALLAHLGSSETRMLLDSYFAQCPPESFPAVEAHHFSNFLRGRADVLALPHVNEVLSFEHGLVKAALFGTSSEVRWTVDPTALFDSLEGGQVPADLPKVDSVMQLSAADAIS
jgi:uncharacterized protein